MSSKEKKVDEPATSQTDQLEERIRLSVKGALRESGKQPTFVLDSKFATDEYEKEQGLLDQLENVDFYIDQGFCEVARSTLERLNEIYPNNPLILQRLDNLPEPEPETVPTLESKIEDEPPGSFTEESAQTEEPSIIEESAMAETEPVDPLSDEMENLPELHVAFEVAVVTDEVPVITDEVPVIESESYDDESAEETAEETLAESTDQTVSDAESQIVAEEYQEERQEEYQEEYQEECREETASAAMEETEYEPPQENYEFRSSRETAPLNITDFAEVKASLKALFQEEAEDEFEPDFKIHFNVGQAYFDLGIIDDAIEEFQVSCREMQSAGVMTYYYECCVMLGRCFRMRDMNVAALIWLKRAVDAERRTDEEYRKARYELASLHEEMGDCASALELYKQIAKTSPDYLDVSEKIEKLQPN